jgi:ELWxxDGT repeat protein
MKKTLLFLAIAALIAPDSQGQVTLAGDINSGSSSSFPSCFVPFNDQLYMVARTAGVGYELFAYDGVSAPGLAEDVTAGTTDGVISTFGASIAVLGDSLYFAGNNGDGRGMELMKKGSAGVSTRAGLDIYTGPLSSEPLSITSFKGKIYFSAIAATTGRELYVYNPATNTSTLISDIQPGGGGSTPDNFCIYKDKLYFSALTTALGRELYSYDPATNATTLVKDLTPAFSSTPYSLKVIDNKLYFVAFTDANGYELYNYDGVTVTRVTDLNPGKGHGLNTGLALYKNKIYFSGDDGTSGTQLFSYDPATGTTALAYSFHPSGGYPVGFTVYGGKLYFQATEYINGFELWETDGTTTKMVQDLNTGSDASFPSALTVWKGKLHFAAQTATYGTELYTLSTPEGLGLPHTAFNGSVVVAPNPAGADTRLLLNLDGTQKLRIALSDISGKQLYTVPPGEYQSGHHEVALPMRDYPAGNYIYEISDDKGEKLMTGKINKL